MAARFSRSRRGDIKVRLSADERNHLRMMCTELEALLDEADMNDPATARLFPDASLDDQGLIKQMHDMVQSDLESQRREALGRMQATLDDDRLSDDDAATWLAVCNDARLVIGVRIAVTEESRPSDFTGEAADAFASYRFLTALVSQMIAALSGITEIALAPAILKAQLQDGMSDERGTEDGGS